MLLLSRRTIRVSIRTSQSDSIGMENTTDIDMVITIPDTPDRPVRRGSVIGREVKRRARSPEAPVRYQREEYRRTRPPPVPENGDNSENGHHRSRGSGSSALFRRAVVEKDKGKSVSTGPSRVEKNPVLNGHVHVTTASIREFRDGSSNSCSSPLRGDRNKGKEKVECGSVSNRETIDISSGKQQNRGTKRLVRHGCISPHAIAARARQVADTGPVSVEPEIATPAETASSIDIREIVSENDGRARGKRPEISRDRDVAERWFSTRNRKLSIGSEMMNDTRGICSSVSRLDVHETGEVEREARQQRRRKTGVTTSSRALNEPDVCVIDSSGEPSSSRPSRIHNHNLRHGVTQVLEIDDEVRVVQGPPRRVENDESEMKARQMEADEILARELQEELYRETAMIRDEQIDENIARLLEQEENALRASSSRASSSRGSTRNTRSSNTTAANQGGRSRLEARLQQHTSRRQTNPPPHARAPVRAPPRVRGQRLGGGVPASLHSALNLSFPDHMALEMRMDFLEQLENVIGHSINNRNLLHMDRDFTEDDYELLLALDENNHRHGGASSRRINDLPVSTVQNDNYQETCVICLDTPTIGDTIRHLPCLHKFHKDCIDPWLGRSKACPVCKSSVT